MFIIEDYGGGAVNANFIDRIYLDNSGKLSDGTPDGTCSVEASLTDGTYATFAVFEEGNRKENLAAAKKFIAELVNRINGEKLKDD